MAAWDDLLTTTDREVIGRGSYGKPRGLGISPAVLVIDAQYNYVGVDAPILESMDEWPSSGGERAHRAVEALSGVAEAGRASGCPVIYTRQVQRQTTKFDGFQSKVVRDGKNYLQGSKGTEIVPEAGLCADDLVVDKSYASAFFGTPLISYLVKMRIDTLIIGGGSTSGCVRATAVDAITHNFNVAIVEDGVFDRIDASHKVALLDFWMKYGDVVTAAEATAYLASVRQDSPRPA